MINYMSRKIYLKTMSLDTAKDVFFSNLVDFFSKREIEVITVREALGRITASPIYATISSPTYHSCAMDGIMVKSIDTKMARDCDPLILSDDQYQACDTGDPLLSPFDSVIMAEDLSEAEAGVKIFKAISPWENVRPIGEDIIEKDLIYPQDHRLEPIDLSVLLAAGIKTVSVYKKPTIAIIPTGDEIVSGDESLKIGEIIESNTAMFHGMAIEAGAECDIFPIIPDNLELLISTVKKAITGHDVVAVVAGSSAGREDFTVKIAQELGEVYVHGIAIRPGKPAILAKINGKPFIGLPGYPVSGHIVFDELICPILLKKGNSSRVQHSYIPAKLTRPIVSSLQYQEYIRVKIGKINDQYTATPADRGAGSSLSLAKSDGYVIVPQNLEGYNRGEQVEVRLHKPLTANQIEQRIVVIGSHDMVLDLINDLFAKAGKKISLISSHVGSLAGLQSLKAGECHVAPSHLLGKDGKYNDEAMRMFFKGNNMIAINIVGRRQGIILPKGNPMKIEYFNDLRGKSMINRQRGAGTRILFDYLLKQNSLTPDDFIGYAHEATTHLGVALAVKNGDCDFGIGVESAANKMDCDFRYLTDEAYEFITFEKYYRLPAIQELIELLKSNLFRDNVNSLGGYETSNSGEVRIFKA